MLVQYTVTYKLLSNFLTKKKQPQWNEFLLIRWQTNVETIRRNAEGSTTTLSNGFGGVPVPRRRLGQTCQAAFCFTSRKQLHLNVRSDVLTKILSFSPYAIPPGGPRHNLCAYANFTWHFVTYTHVNKNPLVWNFLSPKPEATCGTVAIIIRVVLLSPCLRIRAVSLPSIHYNQSHRVCINRRQYICLIWN